MKVMLLSHSSAVENMGGAEITLLQMIDRWRALRSDVEFVVVARTPTGHLQPELDRRNVPHRTIDYDSWVLPVVRVEAAHVIYTDKMDSEAVQWLVEFMREQQPDIVITNTIVSPWAALAAKHLGIVHVWMVHEYGDLDHGLDFRIGRAETFEDIGILSELVVANSEAVRNHIAQWIPPSKLTIAYPVIDLVKARTLSEVTPRLPVARPHIEGALNTVMVGRLAPSKGQWRLLEAIARLRDEGIPVTATLVGVDDTVDGRKVLAAVQDLGLQDRVVSTGETTNPFAFVAQADVGVIASDSEAFGRVTVEYMALGKPVIASNAGASPELVQNGETGWLFDKSSIENLSRALREAHADRGELSRRGIAARHAVDERLMSAHSLDDAIQAIEGAVAAGPQPLRRLPNIVRERLDFPRAIDQYLHEQFTIQHAVRGSMTWRIGSMLTAPVRWATSRMSARDARHP